jgi:isoprenylcysteine carboxyl methyltransferase (ICMT) family protein YpbQ
MVWYVLLIVAVALERLAELIFSTRNRAWSRARGGVEFGAEHYPVMFTLHIGLLAACLVEAIVLQPPVHPRTRLADAGDCAGSLKTQDHCRSPGDQGSLD